MSVDESIKISIGHLLQNADECSKRVLTAFNPSAKRNANIKAISSFNLEILEPFATFLGIDLADSEDNKIFTKESLVSRILHGIQALLPSQCSECSEDYVVEHNHETHPLFTCYQCFQGSHDCDRVREVHESLSSIGLLAGHVWLCSVCHANSNPVKPRRSKSRHNSTSKDDQALNRISQELNSQLNSPSQSPEPLDDDQEDENGPPTEPHPLVTTTVRAICSKYKTRNCPHGARGDKIVDGAVCKFLHPKSCFKYSHYGTHKKLGCNKGDNCKFYHPKLCKFSVKDKCCTNKACTFVHLRGTKRKSDKNKPEVNKPPAVSQTAVSKPSPSETPEPHHFLELKMLMENMRSDFNLKIASIKASLVHPNFNWQPMSQYHMPQHLHQIVPPAPLSHALPNFPPHNLPPNPPQQMTFIPHSSQ